MVLSEMVQDYKPRYSTTPHQEKLSMKTMKTVVTGVYLFFFVLFQNTGVTRVPQSIFVQTYQNHHFLFQ